MTCAESRLRLHPYIDGELDVIDSVEVERHAHACPACAASINDMRALRATFQNPDLAYAAPAGLAARIRRALPAEKPEPRASLALRFWQVFALTSAAAAILLFFFHPGAVAGRDQLLDQAVAAHVRSLMANHLTDVASTDQHTVKPWFAGHLDFSLPVKDLAAQGFPLVGGRLDYLDSHQVAALVYHRNKHVINILVWPSTQGTASTSSAAHNYHGFSVVERDVRDLHLCAVSDLNPDELRTLVDLLVE